MNKDNKILGLAMRFCIIITWIVCNISLFVMLTGMKNVDVDGMDKDNAAERMLKVIGDFGDKTTLYYVTFGMLIICLVLAVLSKYKTGKGAFIAKIVFLFMSVYSAFGGFEYLKALSDVKGIKLAVSGTSTDAITKALSDAGYSGNAESVAKTLGDKDAASALIAGYFFPLLVLFVLMITSIHCLVKKKDPNCTQSSEG
ncbi:MAG: hypothetical protein J5956_08885 [Ruminococcus sp.]|nr:hypothetical protein [Ruminococcus sp.]